MDYCTHFSRGEMQAEMDLVKVRVATLAVLTCWGARLGLPGTHPQSPGAGDISRAPRVRDRDVPISLGGGCLQLPLAGLALPSSSSPSQAFPPSSPKPGREPQPRVSAATVSCPGVS